MTFKKWFSQSGEMEMFKPAFEKGWNACAADRIGFLEREIERLCERYYANESFDMADANTKISINSADSAYRSGVICAALEYLKEQAQKEQ